MRRDLVRLLLKAALIATALCVIYQGIASANDLEQAKLHLVQARQVAAGIADEPCCRNTLGTIVKLQAWAGDITSAQETLELIKDSIGRDEAILDIAKAQGKAGQLIAARGTASLLQNKHWRADALRSIAYTQAEVGNFRDAIGLALQIDLDEARGFALELIAAEQARAGDLPSALSTAAAIPRNASRDGLGLRRVDPQIEVQKRLAIVQAERGDWITGLMLAARITDNHEQAYPMWIIAIELAETGSGEQARAIAAGIAYYPFRVCALDGVALIQAKANQWLEAIKTAEAIGIGTHCGLYDVKIKVTTMTALSQIATIAAEHNNDALSMELVGKLTNDEVPYALESIAAAQARRGDIPNALNTLSDVRATHRMGALIAIAQTQAKAGDIKQALQSAEGVQEEYSRFHLLGNIYIQQAETGDIPGALKAVASLRDNDRDRPLEKIALLQAKNNDLPGAFKTVTLIPHKHRRPTAFYRIAAEHTDRGKAHEVIALLKDINELDEQAWVLLGIAKSILISTHTVTAYEIAYIEGYVNN